MYKTNNCNSWLRHIILFVLSMTCLFSLRMVFADIPAPGNNVSAPINGAQVQQMTLKSAYQQLAILQERNAMATQNMATIRAQHEAQLKALQPLEVQPAQVAQAQLELANAQAKLNDVQLAILENQRSIAAINSTVTNLNDNLRDIALLTNGSRADTKQLLDAYHQKLTFQKSLLEIENERASTLQGSLRLAEQNVTMSQSWYQNLKQLNQQQYFLEKQNTINAKLVTLQAQRNQWLTKLAALNSELGQLGPDENSFSSTRIHYEMAVLEANERASLLQTQLILLQLQNRLEEMRATEGQNQSIAAYSDANKRLSILLLDLQSVVKVLNGKIQLLTQREQILTQAHTAGVIKDEDFDSDNKLLTGLVIDYQLELQQNAAIMEQLHGYKNKLQSDLNREMARRQGLPGFNLLAWQELGQQIWALPSIVYQGFSSLSVQVAYTVKNLGIWSWSLLSMVVLGWFAFWWLLRRYLRIAVVQVRQGGRKLTTNVLYILLELLRRNILGLVCAGLVISLLVFIEIPYASYAPLLLLIIVWFTFKFIISFSRIFLLETAPTISNHDLHLYQGLKWAFLAGGVLTACTVIVHQLPVPYEVRDFFNRLFMLFLLAVSILLLRGWRVVPGLLEPYVSRKRPYVRRVVSLLSLLIPLTLLSTAIIGLCGYVDLAWTINKHEGVFLLVLTGYVLARGCIVDIAEWGSEVLIHHVRSGWMWSQAILNPLDRVLRLGLLLLAIVILFKTYGWDQSSAVVQSLKTFFSVPLFKLADSQITPLSVTKFVALLCIFWWAARWSREFAYRVLFVNAKDVGVRNSLAVFTQYTMVVIGFFVILWVLGISVLTLAAVMTLFGVGLAFGLRDLFKNYVSGLFLLIERPVKKGDYVSVGGHEGVVSHIGMRSFTVVTGDHMELLVPNSEVFDKPFTNWTSQDNIIRTTFIIKINRVDDPHRVCEMIMEILKQCEAVIAEPSAHVLLKDVGEALIEIEARYHINLEKTPSRANVRSEILFRIWDRFKLEGIQPPHPQQDIYIKDMTRLPKAAE